MKYAIISDIHGNYTAFVECLKKIKRLNIDEIIFCGDYITDFPEPHDVLKLIKECEKNFKCHIIHGNREEYICNFNKDKNLENINVRKRSNVMCTYNLLTKEDLEWLENLPETLEIDIGNENKIYVSHQLNTENIKNCKYKIFGHAHKQFNFRKEGITYINPGSIGISTDMGVIGAQFSTLEITNEMEKIEEYKIKYDINPVIDKLKKSTLYKDRIKWGKVLESQLKTGIDIPKRCKEEYIKMLEENEIVNDESIELWNKAIEKVSEKYTNKI